jgi:hypothetical protein
MATRLSDEQLADFARDMRRMLDALPPPKPREKPTRQRLEGSWLAMCLIAGAHPFADSPNAPCNDDANSAVVALLLRPKVP